MDILKTAIEWAKDELFSTPFFILFGGIFLAASLGFWQLGRTDIAKAYILPTLIAGILLIIVGGGLYYSNYSRVRTFEKEYREGPSEFIESEIDRVEGTLKEYQTIVFKIIPSIIVLAALGIIFLNSPFWRATCITTIAMMIVILFIDGTAHSRIDVYHKELLLALEKLKN